MKLRIGTRGSPLALWQANEVRRRLLAAHSNLGDGDVTIEIIKTTGDKLLDRKLAEAGGKGLFTKEIEEALLARTIDLAVHSMKDMPTKLPDGLVLSAMLPREDPRDALISAKAKEVDHLPQGATVGTASLRRQAQLLNRRPDLKTVLLRGNVETRLRKVEGGEIDATFLALAGLKRLGLESRAAGPIDTETMLPAPAQGAIGIEIREGDGPVAEYVRALDHAPTTLCVGAERELLAALDGSCRTPIAALAEISGGAVVLRGRIVTPDGREMHAILRQAPKSEAARLGRDAGEELKRRGGPRFFAV
ncbi:MAG: hydroxymethylbilane synthase [Alphaproteobacteria bacterium]|nr:hydroxymethylbilane synthase [Alphaproteobacteria bacterium]